MPRSLPVAPDSAAGRLIGVATTVGARLVPRIPTTAQRLLFGGRAVSIDGNTLDPTLRLVSAAQRAAGITGLVIGDDPHASRARVRQVAAALDGRQIHADVSALSIPGPAGDIGARLYFPHRPGAGWAPVPLLVYYHGGGFVIGDLDVFDAVCRLTCRDGGVAVLSIDYRLAPEHPAPAAVDDAYAAFRWAHAHAGDLGALPGRVAVGGDSAGGNLAAVVSRLARDDGGPAPVLQWLIYPVTDIAAQTRSRTLFGDGFLLTKHDMDWFAAQYLGGSGLDPADPRVSPLRADDLSGLPPALIATAGFDPLRDEGERYAAALAAAGTIVDLRRMGSMAHTFINLFPLGGGCAAATGELISALRAHLSRD